MRCNFLHTLLQLFRRRMRNFRGQQKFRRRDISFQSLTYGLWLRLNQNNTKPGLNLPADILRKSYFLFLAERRSLERFHLLLNYSGFLIVHYVCNFEAVEYNRERRKCCLVYLAENGCGLILLLCLSPINESWREKKKKNFSPKKGARLQNEEKKQSRKEEQNSIDLQSFLFFNLF